MLRFERKQAESATEVGSHSLAEGEALLFLGILVGSWVIAIGVGWLVWRMAPF